jgi:hypothetical protein
VSERRRAIVVGFDYYARYLSKLINEYSERWRLQAFPSSRSGLVQALWSLRNADVLISFGGPGPSIALSEAAGMRHIPVIVIWAGSDVLTAAETPFDLAVIKRRGFTNFADGPWLVDELRDIGITADYRPVTAVDASQPVAPFPRDFRVLTYLPEPRRRFYGEERVYALARRMPNVEFLVIGPGTRNPDAPTNVTFCGYVQEVWRRIDSATVLLRLPEHDGKSMLVLETLARARHVVWTHEFPGVHAVCETGEAHAALQTLYEKHRNGTLLLNAAGRNHVRDHFSRPGIAARFESDLDEVVASHGRPRNGKTLQVAISGLGLFSAEVAKEAERLHPEWKTTVLCTNSRAEVAAALLALTRSDVWYSIGSPLTDRWVALCARLLRKPHVIHWVGSDIELLKNSPTLRKRLRSPAIKHLAEVSWSAQELQRLGLTSEIVPLPLRHHGGGGVKPLPGRFTILLYLPKARAEFYGKRECESLLEEFATEAPRVLIVGGGHLRVPSTVEVANLGWRDNLRHIYEQTTVLIRLTPHDGLSLMVLEALSFGRYVMWSKPFPYALHVRSRPDLVKGLRSLFKRHRRGELFPQYTAAEMVLREYTTERAVDQIRRSWESVR